MNYYGSKTEVYNGTARYTKGGLQKRDIIRVNDGYGNYRYKSKLQQRSGKKKGTFRDDWAKAVKKAYKELDLDGFVPVGGKTKDGKALLKRVRELTR
jgi:hypothetical protein